MMVEASTGRQKELVVRTPLQIMYTWKCQ